jgi:hypothetical protein
VVDVRALLGSDAPVGTLEIRLFIPSVDRDGRPIGQSAWVDEALVVLGTLFRGATALPPGRGVWRDDHRGGRLVFDATVSLTSYVDPVLATVATITTLSAFLHRLGRDARQGEVGLLYNGNYHGITSYDEEEPR